MMACILASVATSIHAQEVSPILDDRVEDGLVSASVASEDEPHRGGLELGATLAAAYDDNIFLSKTKPVADMVYRIGPTVAYTEGDAKDGKEGFIQFAYRPTGVIYGEKASDNRVDQQAAIIAAWRGKLTKITYTGGVQKLGDATSDTGRQTDRVEFSNEIRAAWIPREKISVELAAGNRQSNYADPALFDSSKIYGEVALRYAYSPKTELGMAYQVGRFQVDGASEQFTHQVTGTIDWQPREKFHVKLEAGAEHRTTENRSQINPVVEGRVDWTPRQGTKLYLTGYQREEASAFYAGQNYRVKGLTAGVSQRLGGKWTARLEGGRETASYTQVAGSGTSGRKDAIWFVRPALEYRITDEFDISLFYRVSDNSSSASAFGYSQRMTGVELNYKF